MTYHETLDRYDVILACLTLLILLWRHGDVAASEFLDVLGGMWGVKSFIQPPRPRPPPLSSTIDVFSKKKRREACYDCDDNFCHNRFLANVKVTICPLARTGGANASIFQLVVCLRLHSFSQWHGLQIMTKKNIAQFDWFYIDKWQKPTTTANFLLDYRFYVNDWAFYHTLRLLQTHNM